MTKLKDLTDLPEYLTFDDVLLKPNYSEVTPSRVDTGARLTDRVRLKIPVVASPMDTVCEAKMASALGKLGGYGIIHRNLAISEQAAQLESVLKAGIRAGAAVGVGPDFDERVEALVKAGGREICIDSSHGHTKQVIAAVKLIVKNYPEVEVIAGNVATYAGAKALFKAGAKTVKVGMGPGSICTTRVMSGMGVPQLAAVVEGVRAAEKFGGRIVADGGMRASGDMVKALAAGAAAVMLGSLLAGTDEAPGKVVRVKGKRYKAYRGMGSVGAMKQGSASRYGQKWQKGKTKRLVPEGVEGWVPYRGSLESHLYQLVGGLRSGMAYLGARNLKELREKARFIRVSRAGIIESRPHSILIER